MKKDIHPTYYTDTTVTCASCGKEWKTGSTKKEIRLDVCSNCHPFFTGESQRLLDTEGQVDRFYKKLSARQAYVEKQKEKEELQGSPDRPIAELTNILNTGFCERILCAGGEFQFRDGAVGRTL